MDPARTARLNVLAEALYGAEAQIVLAHLNVARPRWIALHPDIKAEYVARAARLMETYGATVESKVRDR